MRARFRVTITVGVSLLAAVAAFAGPGPSPQRSDTPTMTNSTVEPMPEPLPADWPSSARDAQFRGAACESGYGKEAGRQFADAGDDVFPVVGTSTLSAGSAFRAVRHVPFLTRRDVARALLVADPDLPSTFSVELTLTEEGAARAREYSTANSGKCVALVASGKVLWSAPLDSPIESETFVLSGSFSGARGIAIVDLFRQ